jgi:hypothetical protein
MDAVWTVSGTTLLLLILGSVVILNRRHSIEDILDAMAVCKPCGSRL